MLHQQSREERAAFGTEVGTILGMENQTQQASASAIGMLCSSPILTQGSPKILQAMDLCLDFFVLVNMSCVHFGLFRS